MAISLPADSGADSRVSRSWSSPAAEWLDHAGCPALFRTLKLALWGVVLIGARAGLPCWTASSTLDRLMMLADLNVRLRQPTAEHADAGRPSACATSLSIGDRRFSGRSRNHADRAGRGRQSRGDWHRCSARLPDPLTSCWTSSTAGHHGTKPVQVASSSPWRRGRHRSSWRSQIDLSTVHDDHFEVDRGNSRISNESRPRPPSMSLGRHKLRRNSVTAPGVHQPDLDAPGHCSSNTRQRRTVPFRSTGHRRGGQVGRRLSSTMSSSRLAVAIHALRVTCIIRSIIAG